MRKLIVSKWVRNKIDELESYLKNNLKLSTEVTHRYMKHTEKKYMNSLKGGGDLQILILSIIFEGR